jgi:multiple sugar transport system substrate-binding protein
MTRHETLGNRLLTRRHLTGFLAAGATVSLAAACSPRPQAAPKGEPQAEGDVTAWVFPLTSDDKVAFWDALMARFTQENPRVNPIIEILPWTGRLEKMLSAVAAGVPPDIAYLNRDFVPRFADQGAIVPLDTVLTPELLRDFRKEVLDQNRYRGKLFNSPILLSLYIPFHNIDLAMQAGLDPNRLPVTWQEFEEWAAKMTRPGEQWGISHPWSTETATGTMYIWIWQAGGRLIEEPDGKKALFNTPEAVDALEYVKRLFDRGYIPEENKEGKGPGFATGKIGILWWGSNPTPVALQRDAPTLRFKVGNVPQGRKRATYGTLAGYALFAQAPNRRAAEQWIRFMARAENAAELLKPTGYMPPMASLRAEQLWPGDEHRAKMLQEMQYVNLDPQHPFSRDMSRILAEEGQLALLDKKPVKQALADAAKRLEDTIARGS